MGLEQEYNTGQMTKLAGIVKNDGTKPTSMTYGKSKTSFTFNYMKDLQTWIDMGNSMINGLIGYGQVKPGRLKPGKATGSTLDLYDSGPINVPDNKHKQKYTPKSNSKYVDAIPKLQQDRARAISK